MKKGLAAGLLLLTLGVLPGVALAQNPQEEVDKQISKAISDAINARVTTSTAAEAASAPPNNIWGSVGQTMIETSGSGTNFDLSVPVLLMGFDRDVRGRAMTGASLAFYTFSETIGGANTDFYGYNVSPYFAYIFNRNYFLTAKINLGLSYSESSTFTAQTINFGGGFSSTTTTTTDTESYTFSYGLDTAFNALFRPGDGRFLVKGLVRVGYNASETTTDVSTSSRTIRNVPGASGSSSSFTSTTTSSDSIPYGVEGEFGMFFRPRSYGFVGVQWQDSDQPNSNAIYGRIGYEQGFGRAAALGVKYETRIGGDDTPGVEIDVSSIFVTLRVGF